MMSTAKRTPTTDMEVTSIRLERELKERLKKISGHHGYQALIRDILWKFVRQKSGDRPPLYNVEDIRATMPATARVEELCSVSGKPIAVGESMLLGFTIHGELIPLAADSLD
jgi:hypothetical protein